MTARHSLIATLLACAAVGAAAETETISGQPIGMDTRLVFPHALVPGAGGMDFDYFAGFAPLYPEDESHTVVIDFEWGPSAVGPWTVSRDFVNTVPGGKTDLFDTGLFHGDDQTPFVALHFFAGGLMVTSGSFSHVSTVVPVPASAVLMTGSLLLLARRLRRS